MTPADEDALAKDIIGEWMETRDRPDGLYRLACLAIRAAVAHERERCIEAVMRATPDRKNLAIVGEAAHYIAAADAIRRG